MIPGLRVARAGLWGLLLLCLALRLMAWLIIPALPLLIVLLLVVGVMHLLLFGRRG